MTSTRFFSAFAVGAVLTSLLSGCASNMGDHHGGGDRAGSMMHGMEPGSQDMQAMCAMHKQMMAGKPAAEQRAIMDEHMKKMSPQMRQNMQAMQEHCK
ncbi:MAG: hypothetical protein NDJ19_00115 [Ramlibacter sp.]|nr:hypothetical protein [Ramlibacter sp.]